MQGQGRRLGPLHNLVIRDVVQCQRVVRQVSPVDPAAYPRERAEVRIELGRQEYGLRRCIMLLEPVSDLV